ncbi:MAG TPA: type II toxin-antitoxin system VapC family toxin [Planctomycetota bacterium]|nr:type II toxin-antitoxin system VapC family toxin [Planctomycetota bacterium]
MSRQVVVDASAAAAWVLEDVRTPESDRLLAWVASRTLTLVAPAIWSYEILNLLRTAVLRGRLEERDARGALDAIAIIPREIVSIESQGEAAVLGTAMGLQLSAYDAAYVNLAESRGMDLISGDTHILRLRPRFPWIWAVQDFVKSVQHP